MVILKVTVVAIQVVIVIAFVDQRGLSFLRQFSEGAKPDVFLVHTDCFNQPTS